MPRDFYSGGDNVNKRTMKKGLAIVLVLVMVFAMSASAFADVANNISVTVKIDTRSFDTTSKGTLADTVVTKTVTVPSGSTVEDVLEAVENTYGINMNIINAVDSATGQTVGRVLTSVGGVSQNNYSQAQQQNTFLWDYVGTANEYCISGWVYSTVANGSEIFPSYYMDNWYVTAGTSVNLYYTVTGPKDLNTGTWTSDYSNLDVNLWKLYDQLQEKISTSSNEDAVMWAEYEISEFEAALATAKTTSSIGLSAYYFSHEKLTDSNGFITRFQDALAYF